MNRQHETCYSMSPDTDFVTLVLLFHGEGFFCNASFIDQELANSPCARHGLFVSSPYWLTRFGRAPLCQLQRPEQSRLTNLSGRGRCIGGCWVPTIVTSGPRQSK